MAVTGFFAQWLALLYICCYIIQICSGITRGRVLNGELFAQRLQELIYLHLSTVQ